MQSDNPKLRQKRFDNSIKFLNKMNSIRWYKTPAFLASICLCLGIASCNEKPGKGGFSVNHSAPAVEEEVVDVAPEEPVEANEEEQLEVVIDSLTSNESEAAPELEIPTSQNLEEPVASNTESKKESKSADVPKQAVSEKATLNKTATEVKKTNTVLGGAGIVNHADGKTVIKFNRNYTLDLKNLKGEKITVRPGDEIINAHIHNGILRGGTLRTSTGEEKTLNGLQIKL